MRDKLCLCSLVIQEETLSEGNEQGSLPYKASVMEVPPCLCGMKRSSNVSTKND